MSKSMADVALGALEHDAASVAHYADEVKRHVQWLSNVPDFRTAAQARLEDAERSLTAALAVVKAAQKPFALTPINQLVAAE